MTSPLLPPPRTNPRPHLPPRRQTARIHLPLRLPLLLRPGPPGPLALPPRLPNTPGTRAWIAVQPDRRDRGAHRVVLWPPEQGAWKGEGRGVEFECGEWVAGSHVQGA